MTDSSTDTRRPTVAVVGGGYGGSTAAKALDEFADVTLVEPRDAFVHNVAALRALVEPDWLSRIFLPYDRLLENGSVVRSRAVAVDADRITLASGAELTPDFIVLATGSTYPYPAKSGTDETATAIGRYRESHDELVRAPRVLIVGAGPTGLELAGEISEHWPEKRITIVEPEPEILAGPYKQELRDEVRRQLEQRGVEFVLGEALSAEPESPPVTFGPFAVTTRAGRTLEADIWFRCYGLTPVAGYLSGELADARLPDGSSEVTPELQVKGQTTVFALGDAAGADLKIGGPRRPAGRLRRCEPPRSRRGRRARGLRAAAAGDRDPDRPERRRLRGSPARTRSRAVSRPRRSRAGTCSSTTTASGSGSPPPRLPRATEPS